MIPDPIVIPVPERYGCCESPSCFNRLYGRITDKKPMFVFGGMRLCKECLRKLQRQLQDA